MGKKECWYRVNRAKVKTMALIVVKEAQELTFLTVRMIFFNISFLGTSVHFMPLFWGVNGLGHLLRALACLS